MAAAGGLAVGLVGCPLAPDQSQFDPLSTLSTEGEAVVRLYAAPIPDIELIATHPWFAVKPADSDTFHRWEVWQTAGGPYGHVRLDLQSPTSDVGAGGTYILAEVIGAEAEPIVAFIEENSPDYVCQDVYAYFPGPNSNTYAQWVLNQTGWRVTLPWTAIGKAYPPICP